MDKNSIIQSKLLVRRDFSEQQSSQELTNPLRKSLPDVSSELLLFDQIQIPTYDFSILYLLVNWFGIDIFAEIIETSAISLIKRDRLLGYPGGLGVNNLRVAAKDGGLFPATFSTVFSEHGEAIEYQLRDSLKSMSKRGRNRLLNRIESATKVVEFKKEDFYKKVAEETYKDIKGSDKLASFVSSFYKDSIDNIDLANLKDIPSNQTEFLNADGRITHPKDLILRVAEINLDLLTAFVSDIPTVSLPADGMHLVDTKLIRSGFTKERVQDFIKLLSLNNVPDIRPAIESGELSVGDIWRLRQSPNGQKFREWIGKADPKDADELTKIYISSLKNRPFISNMPARMIRYVLTSAVGMINPGLGTTLGMVDSFFVEEILSGFAPKLFLDDLSKLLA